jgi:tetratricopeptide (TPR) repeat protein
LQNLHGQLQQENPVVIAALSGMGGIGKTELALQYAYAHLERLTYPGGICWLRAREDLASQVVIFSRSQNRHPPEDLELAGQMQWCWSNWPELATLVVLDDVQQWSDIQVALPRGPQFKVLLTSRVQFGHPVQRYEIQVLSETAALELLRRLVCDGRIDDELAIAQQICAWLGYLPLGLELVGRYLAEDPDLSLAKLLQRLEQERLRQASLQREGQESAWMLTAERGVEAAFELSWKRLNAAQHQLAAVLSVFAQAEIPWGWVERVATDWIDQLKQLWQENQTELELLDLQAGQGLETARQTLLRFSLLTRTGERLYELHPLLREFFALKREQIPHQERLRLVFNAFVIAEADRSCNQPQRSLIEECSAVIPQLQERIRWSEMIEDQGETALGLHCLAFLYDSQGRYLEAEPLLLRSLNIREQQLGENHLDVAQSINNLAELYRAQGRYPEAEPLYLRSLNIYEQQLGENHPAVATSLNNLAELYRAQGRYPEAEPLYVQACNIYLSSLGPDHPNSKTGLNNFVLFLQQIIAENRTAELSDHPFTQQCLAVLTNNDDTSSIQKDSDSNVF